MQISKIANSASNKSVHFKGIVPEKITKLAQAVRTQAILSDISPIASYKATKMITEDPKALMYGLVGHVDDVISSFGKIGDTQISLRKGGKKVNASVMKYCFNNDSQRYSIKRFGETLAYVDTVLEDNENIYIKYLCSIQGRKKFRGLAQKVLQAAVEDTINQKQVIPEITAIPENIGNTAIDRATLYKFMGADELIIPLGKKGETTFYLHQVYCSKETILEKLDKIAKKDGFIFPQTKEIFEKLK